jgi:hypothetical protein
MAPLGAQSLGETEELLTKLSAKTKTVKQSRLSAQEFTKNAFQFY